MPLACITIYTESPRGYGQNISTSSARESAVFQSIGNTFLTLEKNFQRGLMNGADLATAKIESGEPVKADDASGPDFHFPPVKNGQSIRLRISETYTALASYRLDGDELVFDRSLGPVRANAVVLPAGWYLTANAIPATITQLSDGRIRLDFWNGRP